MARAVTQTSDDDVLCLETLSDLQNRNKPVLCLYGSYDDARACDAGRFIRECIGTCPELMRRCMSLTPDVCLVCACHTCVGVVFVRLAEMRSVVCGIARLQMFTHSRGVCRFPYRISYFALGVLRPACENIRYRDSSGRVVKKRVRSP